MTNDVKYLICWENQETKRQFVTTEVIDEDNPETILEKKKEKMEGHKIRIVYYRKL